MTISPSVQAELDRYCPKLALFIEDGAPSLDEGRVRIITPDKGVRVIHEIGTTRTVSYPVLCKCLWEYPGYRGPKTCFRGYREMGDCPFRKIQ